MLVSNASFAQATPDAMPDVRRPVAETFVESGYAPVNGLEMYYEIYGEGQPLVLIHGGVLNIPLCFGAVIPELSRHRQCIAVELQAHGRTADIDRAMTLPDFAHDVVGLLDHLGLQQADLLTFSIGSLTGLQLLVDHPDRVRRAVLASVHTAHDGYHEEITNEAMWETSTKLPTEEEFGAMVSTFEQLAPAGSDIDTTFAKTNDLMATFTAWTPEQLGAIGSPVMLVYGDNDFVTPEHMHQTHERIPGSQLALLPGATHNQVMQREELIVPLVEGFLAS